jgi:hypothetical protein
LRIRILERPPAREYEGYDVRHLLPGQTYDLTARLGTLLVVAGYAMPEMRQAERVQRGARGAVQRRARRGRTTIRRK